jgi:hypothetical protein
MVEVGTAAAAAAAAEVDDEDEGEVGEYCTTSSRCRIGATGVVVDAEVEASASSFDSRPAAVDVDAADDEDEDAVGGGEEDSGDDKDDVGEMTLIGLGGGVWIGWRRL